MSTEAKLGSAKFAALHKALFHRNIPVRTTRLEIELPIEIFHWLRHDTCRCSRIASRGR